MILDPDDCDRFFRIHKALTLYVNRRLKVARPPKGPENEIVALPQGDRLKVREALLGRLDLIGEFVEENPYDLDAEDLEIVRSWGDLVAGDFYVLRHLKKHSIFLAAEKPTLAYGVVALSEPFDEVVEQPLPILCKTVLLPFKGRIVYDGLLQGYNLIFGRNITRELKDAYDGAKERHGIVTSLPAPAPAEPARSKPAARKAAPRKKAGRVKAGLIGRWRITWMEGWDQDYVDEEVEGFFEFRKGGRGEFQFGYVRGGIDYREVERDGRPGVEFSWDGNDEMDPAQGRGWAALDEEGEAIEGRIFLHQGDDSAFRAARKAR